MSFLVKQKLLIPMIPRDLGAHYQILHKKQFSSALSPTSPPVFCHRLPPILTSHLKLTEPFTRNISVGSSFIPTFFLRFSLLIDIFCIFHVTFHIKPSSISTFSMFVKHSSQTPRTVFTHHYFIIFLHVPAASFSLCLAICRLSSLASPFVFSCILRLQVTSLQTRLIIIASFFNFFGAFSLPPNAPQRCFLLSTVWNMDVGF